MLEAEISAILEGVALTLQWSTEPAVIQSDCSKALDGISNGCLTLELWTFNC